MRKQVLWLLAFAGSAAGTGCAALPAAPSAAGAPADTLRAERSEPLAAAAATGPRSDLSDAVASVVSGPPSAPRTAVWFTASSPPRPTITGDPAGPPEAEAGNAAAGSDHELAKKLANPVASLISVPFQSNWDSGIGPDERGERYQLNVQPVIPISLNEDWNVISRTIMPIIHQDQVVPGTDGESGVGDITQNFFFSPKEPTEAGWIWGAGPVALLPTAADDYLGADKWGAGPTFVALKQDSGWTMGALANQIWSFAGNDDRNEVNAAYVQPFLSYTTHDAWTFALNSESTYNWLEDDLGVPVNLMVSKLVRIGGHPVQFQVGTRYWAERTEDGPEGFGFRFTVTFLFPTGN